MRYRDVLDALAGGDAREWALGVLGDIAVGGSQVRGVRHPLGFLCLPLVREGDLGVCVHVWTAAARRARSTTSQVHCHSWDLVSHVLYGQVRNVHAVVTDTSRSPTHRVFEVVSTPSGDVVRPTPRTVAYAPGRAELFGAGETYTLAAGAFRSSVIPEDGEAALSAGAVLRESAPGAVAVHAKGGSGDVVTDLDLAAEKPILDRIRAEFPSHRIVAEESGAHDGDLADGGWTWLVDPLDGTNNVAIGLPAYVVGLALCAGGRPVLGVVHEPLSGRTWSAVAGAGARGPAGPLTGPPRRELPHGPVLTWTQGHGVSRRDPAARSLKMTMDARARRVLQLWAPLLCWAMLARGDIDGMIGYRAEGLDLVAEARRLASALPPL
ncbi:inositol monophosphatase family protein [Microbispora sp. H10836]|uniref:inositol monophosphatase family protein n=1 Tax=Microbispora sp. H10836 TaxID=2729106 RepID=UPI0014745AC4|nr:inositol monophosphatase family protein [Microbispora sp. H10836]